MYLSERQVLVALIKAKTEFAEQFEKLLKNANVKDGDSISLTYKLCIGSQKQPEPERCSEKFENNKCHLMKGHIGEHCAVIKWSDVNIVVITEKVDID